MDADLFRYANVTIAFLIAGTLSWRHVFYRNRNGFDNRLRSATSILVFAWVAVSSGVALSRDLPLVFTVKVTTVLLAAYLAALWTPWRWQLPRR